MHTATSKIYFDKEATNTKGQANVKIRVTFDRKHKYYKTNIFCTPKEYERAINAKRRTDSEKELYKKIHSYEQKAIDVLKDLEIFTFDLFEEMYLTNRDAATDVYAAFDKKIKELNKSEKIGTAVGYECAKKSLQGFKENLRFADVSVSFLNEYEKWMIKQGNTLTTVGFYLRNLRAIWNGAKIAAELNPFGVKHYEIPTGANKKKALTMEEIGKIFNYAAPVNSISERSRDLWIFIYLCNGLNVKDLCLLKQKNIKGNIIEYQRAKTVRKKTIEQIQISLKPQAKEIIRRWGIISLDPEAFVFPFITKDMDAIRQRQVYQQLTQTTNKNMKLIAKELKLKTPVTTYAARHSFATVLKRSGASVEMISEALGHSDLKTTKSYLDSFEVETLHHITDNLLPKTAVNE